MKKYIIITIIILLLGLIVSVNYSYADDSGLFIKKCSFRILDDKYIVNVKGHTTLNVFKTYINVPNPDKQIEFPSYGNGYNYDLEFVKTGDEVKINGTQYTIIVLGDIDRDGKCTYKDILIEKDLVKSKISSRDSNVIYKITDKDADEITIQAADLNHNGKINGADLNRIVHQKFPTKPTDGVKNPNPNAGQNNSSNITMPSDQNMNEIQKKVVNIAVNYSNYGIVPEPHYCLRWVKKVYQKAGLTTYAADCASCAGYNYGVSSDWSKIQIGAAVYGQYTKRNAYGHVGIYIGNGKVIHNLEGKVKTDSLQDWVSKYNGKCWGWYTTTPLVSGYPIQKGLCARGNH